MFEQILHDLNETDYPANSLESRISAIFQQEKILLGDSHFPPHDIGSKIIARAKIGVVSQYLKLQKNIYIASTMLASTT